MTRKLPSLNALRAFEAAARLGGVGQAAKELHVTHGAVSRQIRTLEDELGSALFEREGRGIKTTAVGQRLRDASGKAFEELRDAWSALQHDGAQAPLVLGCSGSVLARWMIPRLDRLSRELPEVKLHLSAQDDSFSSQWNGLDAALLSSTPPWPSSWRVDELAEERIGPVLSPRYPGAKRLRGQPAKALIGEPLLHTASRPQAWPYWAKAMRIKTSGLDQAQSFPHLYYLLEAAVAGLGVAIAPAPLVADDIVAGRLIAPWGFVPTAARWLLAAPQRRRNPQIDLLAAWLRNELVDE